MTFIFSLAFFVLAGLSTVGAADSDITTETILKQEIDRMLEETLPRTFTGDPGGLLARRIEEYRTSLRTLRETVSDESDPGPEDFFDRLETVLEAWVALREQQFDNVDDRLDQLRDELEEHRETGEEEKGLLRADWIETYDRRLRLDDELQRHQGVLIRAFGLLGSRFIRSDLRYRFESTLRIAERLVPDVLRELHDAEDRSRHSVRFYTDLLALLQNQLGDLEDTERSERFYRHVRRSGGFILQLKRRGIVRSVPNELTRRIRSLLERDRD